MRNAQAKITKGDADELLSALKQAAGNKDLLSVFLADLLTPAEWHELIARWQIVKLLAAGNSQREVSKKLHVTLATINRGARVLQNSKGFTSILKIKNR